MIEFLILIAVAATAYFAWRIVDQLPDIVYRLSEVQRDIADLRRQLGNDAKPAIDAAVDEDETPAQDTVK